MEDEKKPMFQSGDDKISRLATINKNINIHRENDNLVGWIKFLSSKLLELSSHIPIKKYNDCNEKVKKVSVKMANVNKIKQAIQDGFRVEGFSGGGNIYGELIDLTFELEQLQKLSGLGIPMESKKQTGEY